MMLVREEEVGVCDECAPQNKTPFPPCFLLSIHLRQLAERHHLLAIKRHSPLVPRLQPAPRRRHRLRQELHPAPHQPGRQAGAVFLGGEHRTLGVMEMDGGWWEGDWVRESHVHTHVNIPSTSTSSSPSSSRPPPKHKPSPTHPPVGRRAA